MKKHAFLITVYKQPELLNRLISDYADIFDIYIHIDKKSKLTSSDFISHENVSIIKRHKVNWGGIGLLYAMLDLLSLSSKKKYDYYHVISAQCCVVCKVEDFDRLMDSKSHLEYSPLPYSAWEGNGGFDRVNYYQFFDTFNVREAPLFYKIINFLIRVQRKIGIKRRGFPCVLYGGEASLSLTHEAVEYVIDFLNLNPGFLKRFKFTFAPEEMFFQTILLNAPLHLKETISDDKLRYIRWDVSPAPKILDEEDYDNIKNGKFLFARKVDLYKSSKLLEFLRKGKI